MVKAVVISRPLNLNSAANGLGAFAALIAALLLASCAETAEMRAALAPPPPTTNVAATQFSHDTKIQQRVFTMANLGEITDIQPEAGVDVGAPQTTPCGTKSTIDGDQSPLAVGMGNGTMRFAMLREEALEPSSRPAPSPMIRYTVSLPDPAGKTCSR